MVEREGPHAGVLGELEHGPADAGVLDEVADDLGLAFRQVTEVFVLQREAAVFRRDLLVRDAVDGPERRAQDFVPRDEVVIATKVFYPVKDGPNACCRRSYSRNLVILLLHLLGLIVGNRT